MGCWEHSATATFASSRGGSIWPTKPSSLCAAVQGLEAGSRIERVVVHDGEGQYAQCLRGQGFGGRARCVPTGVFLWRTQAQHGFRGALDQHAAWLIGQVVARRHELGVGVEG